MFNFDNLKNHDHTFVIAEAGSNWKCGSFNEDLQCAKELINVASECGADAVKFQTFRSETVYVPDAGQSDYLRKSDFNQNINDIFNDLSMPYEMIPILSKHAKEKKILFMSTPFSIEDAKHIDPYVELHKIASYEINHLRLFEFILKTKKPVIFSTGASDYSQIDFVVNLAKENKNNTIALLQCTAKYPAPINSLNLLAISQIKQKYRFPVGLSDHSIEPLLAPILAIGIGATIIEKHFTLNKNSPGPDHKFALEPKELKLMINSIRKADKAKGDGNKIILDDEYELQQFAARSLQATKKILKGDILKEGFNFDVLRSGSKSRGLDARFLNAVNGKKAIADIDIGEAISEYD